jgi:hypothetical protein
MFMTITTDEYFLKHRLKESRDTSVGIATGYWLDEGGVGVRVPVE